MAGGLAKGTVGSSWCCCYAWILLVCWSGVRFAGILCPWRVNVAAFPAAKEGLRCHVWGSSLPHLWSGRSLLWGPSSRPPRWSAVRSLPRISPPLITAPAAATAVSTKRGEHRLTAHWPPVLSESVLWAPVVSTPVLWVPVVWMTARRTRWLGLDPADNRSDCPARAGRLPLWLVLSPGRTVELPGRTCSNFRDGRGRGAGRVSSVKAFGAGESGGCRYRYVSRFRVTAKLLASTMCQSYMEVSL